MWWRWREGRDELFRTHPQSPSPGHVPLKYFPYDRGARVAAKLREVVPAPVAIDASGGETVTFQPVARAEVHFGGRALSLEMYWLEGYGGGAFVPFRDATSGRDTCGGGRYLLDTVKGADLGGDGDALVLDFNFAYNPSCAYDPRWSCPLAPPANRLPIEIRAGERIS